MRGRCTALYSTFEQFTTAGGTAYSDCGIDAPSFTSTEVYSGTCPTTITRIYSVLDLCGNLMSCPQTITINDITPPVITRTPEDLSVECFEDIPAPYPGYAEFNYYGNGRVYDNCSDVTLIYLGDSAPVGDGCPTTIFRTYRFVDECGNLSADYIQQITINDSQNPVIAQMPRDTITVCDRSTINSFLDFERAGGVVTDNCGIDTSSFEMVSQVPSGGPVCPITSTTPTG
jgi:hypothetical protein